MKVETTVLPGVVVITPRRFEDERGYLSETWSRRAFAAFAGDIDFVQDNQSLSRRPGTLRGLHFQAPPHAQDKLVRVVRGRILDVAVDARLGSPTWRRWAGVELSADNGKQLFVPKGFLHGFVTLEPDTEVIYKCSAAYHPGCEGAVRFDDPEIAIDWGLGREAMILSDKDAGAPCLRDIASPFLFGATP